MRALICDIISGLVLLLVYTLFVAVFGYAVLHDHLVIGLIVVVRFCAVLPYYAMKRCGRDLIHAFGHAIAHVSCLVLVYSILSELGDFPLSAFNLLMVAATLLLFALGFVSTASKDIGSLSRYLCGKAERQAPARKNKYARR